MRGFSQHPVRSEPLTEWWENVENVENLGKLTTLSSPPQIFLSAKTREK
jgi:hypothetical protein